MVPTRIVNEGKTTTSPKEICKEFSGFFHHKIDKIRKSFVASNISPIQILQKLIPRKQLKFILKEISLERIYEIINNMKTSNTCYFNGISSAVMKEIPHILSL